MKFIRNVFFIVLALLTVPLAFNALSYLNFNIQFGFLRLKQTAIDTGWYLPAYYAHVIAAGIILLIGLFQINPSWGLVNRKVHRFLGKVYVGGILFFSAPGGLIMSFFINRGPWVLLSFLLQCAVWFGCTYLAYRYIRLGNVQAHRQWMLRSYAVTLAAVTLRVYAFLGSWSFDLANPSSYAVIAWLSWVLNLLICELYLSMQKTRAITAG